MFVWLGVALAVDTIDGPLESKTEEGYFIGFPPIWNVVCLYLYLFASRRLPSSPFHRRVLFACRSFACIRFALLDCVPSSRHHALGGGGDLRRRQPVSLSVVTAVYLTGVGAIHSLRGRGAVERGLWPWTSEGPYAISSGVSSSQSPTA